MAKTASLNATNRPGVRCTEGGSCPALPPGARAGANERTQRATEAAHSRLIGDGITTDASHCCAAVRSSVSVWRPGLVLPRHDLVPFLESTPREGCIALGRVGASLPDGGHSSSLPEDLLPQDA